MALTTPDASVPGISQCSQPWVCDMNATEFWVPPTTKTFAFQRVDQRFDFGLVGHHVFEIAADRETHMAIGVLIADVTELAQRIDIQNALGTGAHRPDFLAAVRHMLQYPGPRMGVVLPLAEVLQHGRVHVLKAIRTSGFDG